MPMTAFVVVSNGGKAVSQLTALFHSPPVAGPIHVAVVCARAVAQKAATMATGRTLAIPVSVFFIVFGVGFVSDSDFLFRGVPNSNHQQTATSISKGCLF